MNSGAHGLAVVSALYAASDPKSVAIELFLLRNQGKNMLNT